MKDDEGILWYNYNLSDSRDIVKCIKHIQKICRSSLEYDEWQRHCKYRDATDCPVCGDNYYEKNSKCESHHYPKTMYEVVEEILDEHLEKNDFDELLGFEICKEVMDKHQFKQVHYINLCVHCHKKYHSGHPDVVSKIEEIFNKKILDEKKDIVNKKSEPLFTENFIAPGNEMCPSIVKNENTNDFIEIDISLNN